MARSYTGDWILCGEAGEVFVLQAHIVPGAVDQPFDLRIAELAYPARRAADPQFALADLLARGDQRAGTDKGMLANHRTIQDQRTHPDQRAIANAARMHHRLV